MLIPRSGQLGAVFQILGKAYSTKNHRDFGAATLYYYVPLVGQNHGNLCGDACVTMLSRWSRIALPGTSNLKIHAMDFREVTEFFKAVKRYKSLSRDKMRDECVKMFNKYLKRDSPLSILPVCKIQTESIAFQKLGEQVEDCVAKKTDRDNQFGGEFSFANRWRRHTTKEQGYVVDGTVFDMLVTNINEAFYHSNSVGELINNPRATPFSGLVPDDITRKYGGFLERVTFEIGTTCFNLYEFMDDHGPLMCCLESQHPIYEKFRMIPRIGHYIVVTGLIYESETLIYNDPWKGANMKMSFQEFDHMLARTFNFVVKKDLFKPEMRARKQRGNLA